jgi:hypothetical protein
VAGLAVKGRKAAAAARPGRYRARPRREVASRHSLTETANAQQHRSRLMSRAPYRTGTGARAPGGLPPRARRTYGLASPRFSRLAAAGGPGTGRRREGQRDVTGQRPAGTTMECEDTVSVRRGPPCLSVCVSNIVCQLHSSSNGRQLDAGDQFDRLPLYLLFCFVTGLGVHQFIHRFDLRLRSVQFGLMHYLGLGPSKIWGFIHCSGFHLRHMINSRAFPVV